MIFVNVIEGKTGDRPLTYPVHEDVGYGISWIWSNGKGLIVALVNLDKSAGFDGAALSYGDRVDDILNRQLNADLDGVGINQAVIVGYGQGDGVIPDG